MLYPWLISFFALFPPTNPAVHIYGSLYKIMHHNNMVRDVELPHLDPVDLYALGALENLKGEILILNGKANISYEIKGELHIDDDYDHAATLLVASYVHQWDSIALKSKAKNLNELEKLIDTHAAQHGLDTEKPFPFLLKGTFHQIDWHVINWPEGDTEHTHEKHKTSGANGCIKGQNAIVLGFFSKHHAGIFTHHTTFLHMHVKCDKAGVVGHVDDIESGKKVWLYLPRT